MIVNKLPSVCGGNSYRLTNTGALDTTIAGTSHKLCPIVFSGEGANAYRPLSMWKSGSYAYFTTSLQYATQFGTRERLYHYIIPLVNANIWCNSRTLYKNNNQYQYTTTDQVGPVTIKKGQLIEIRAAGDKYNATGIYWRVYVDGELKLEKLNDESWASGHIQEFGIRFGNITT